MTERRQELIIHVMSANLGSLCSIILVTDSDVYLQYMYRHIQICDKNYRTEGVILVAKP
jgi:hypothetical protein